MVGFEELTHADKLVFTQVSLYRTSLLFFPRLDTIHNGPLGSGSTYKLLQRGLDDKRNVIETGEWTEEISTPKKIVQESTSSVGLIVGVVVAVILIIVIVSAVFLYLKRRNVEESRPFVGKYVLTILKLQSWQTFCGQLVEN
jgi:hypothetical protein